MMHAADIAHVQSFIDTADDASGIGDGDVALQAHPFGPTTAFSHTEPLDSCEICRLAAPHTAIHSQTATGGSKMIATLTLSPSSSADSFGSAATYGSDDSSPYSFTSPTFPPSPRCAPDTEAEDTINSPVASVFIFPTPPMPRSVKVPSVELTPPTSTEGDDDEKSRYHDCVSLSGVDGQRSPSSPAFALPSPKPIHESQRSPPRKIQTEADIGLAITTDRPAETPNDAKPTFSEDSVNRRSSFRTKPLILGLGLEIVPASASPDKPAKRRTAIYIGPPSVGSSDASRADSVGTKEKRTSIQNLRYTTSTAVEPPSGLASPPSPPPPDYASHRRASVQFKLRSSLLAERSRTSVISAPADSLASRRGKGALIPLTLSGADKRRPTLEPSKWSASTRSASTDPALSPPWFDDDILSSDADTAASFLDLSDSESDSDTSSSSAEAEAAWRKGAAVVAKRKAAEVKLVGDARRQVVASLCLSADFL